MNQKINRNPNSLVENLYEILKAEIRDVLLFPEDSLSEANVAKKYDVSRTPVKQAFSRLERDELIYVKPQIGTYVSKIKISKLYEDLVIRELLESAIIEDVKKSITKNQLNKLEKNLMKQRSIMRDDHVLLEKSRLFWELDNEFHESIFASVNLSFVWKMIRNDFPNMNRYRVLSNATNLHNLKLKIKDHENIFNYLNNGDFKINEIYKKHILADFDEVILKLKKIYPNYFE